MKKIIIGGLGAGAVALGITVAAPANADPIGASPPAPAPGPALSPEVAQALNKGYADYVTWPCGLSLGSVNGFPLPSLRYKQCDPAPQPAPAN
jgi:hypothetical protein